MTALAQTIPNGYKQTEVGVIPSDWEVKRMGDIGESIIGLTYSPSDVVEYGTLVHRSSNIQNNQLFYNDNVYVDKVINEKLVLKDSDILICVRNGSRDLIGKSALIKGKSVGETFGAFMSIFRSEKYQPFIFYLILSNIIQQQINQSLGATINQITNKTLNNFLIPYPSKLSEQKSISSVLSDLDSLIQKTEKLIAKKKAIKQGAMQKLLTGKRRLPGFSGEWEKKQLGELFDFYGGHTASREQLSDKGYCYLHYGDIHGSLKQYIDVQDEFIDIPKLQVSLSKVANNSMLDDGDVVFVDASEDKEGTSRHVVISNQDNIPFISGLHTIVAKSKDASLDKLFKRYCFQSLDIKNEFIYYAVGTKVSGISKSNIIKINLSYPKVPEQIAIANILVDMDTELINLESKLKKYNGIKQGAMQVLLTGKIRLIKN